MTAIDQPALITRLRRILPAVAGEREAEFRLIGPVYSGLYSQVYQLRVNGSDDKLAVKVCLTPPSGEPDGDFASLQFSEMSEFHAAMAKSFRFRIPRPIALEATHGIIVLEWLEGQSLHDLSRGRMADANRMVEGMALAGGWLRHFHQAGPIGEANAPLACLSADVEELGQRLKTAKVTSSSAWDCFSSLIGHMDRLRGLKLEQSWLHGDFQPRNVVISNDAVYGLDMAFSTTGLTLKDAARMLNRFEWSTLTRGTWRSLPYRLACEEAFVAAFLPDCFPEMRFALWWFRMLDHLQFLARYHQDVPGWLRHLHLVACSRLATRRARRRLADYEYCVPPSQASSLVAA